jgi:tRNA (guanine10-N2)-dimethyltransferase
VVVFKVTSALTTTSERRLLYFLLRGENELLATGELRALLEAVGLDVKLNCYTMLCTVEAPIEAAREVFERAGFTREVGVVLGVYDAYSEDDAKLLKSELKGVRVYSTILKSTVPKDVAAMFTRVAEIAPGYRSKSRHALFFTDGFAVLGERLWIKDVESLIERGRKRPFTRSIAIRPDVARALINLTRARRGDILIDPFAGTGTILLEAWDMGVLAIGVDVDYELVRGMQMNISHASAPCIAILGDSAINVYREVDRVATDLPYGRGASTHGAEIKALYESFIHRLSEYLSKRGFAAFMSPLWLEDTVDEHLSMYGFKLVERYYDYVHGGLTRVISVVRRW